MLPVPLPKRILITQKKTGQGVSVAVGMAAAGKYDKKDYRVYTLTGDGEIQEGQIWEVSVIQIWLKRWLTTARTTFLLRLDSLCLHRLISRIRVFFHFSVNNCYYYRGKERFAALFFYSFILDIITGDYIS